MLVSLFDLAHLNVICLLGRIEIYKMYMYVHQVVLLSTNDFGGFWNWGCMERLEARERAKNLMT